MNIQPITYNISLKPIAKNNIATLSCEQSQQKQIKELSNIYYQPINFGSTKRSYESDKPKLKEKSGEFVFSKLGGLTCPSCGKRMLNQKRFEKIAEELKSVPSDQYLDVLGEYTEFMRPIEESVYNEILAESQKPGASKDIRTLLVSLRDKKLPVLQEAQMRQVKKMRSLANTLPAQERKVLLAKISNLQEQIKKKNASAPFRRKIMLDRISKIKIKNKKKYEKLQRIAKNFPTSSDMNSAWIVKYSGKNKHNEDWDSYSIACRFLESSIANTDHILAYDIENTHDDISNYMSMHAACNGQKANKPFLQWLYEDKENRIKYMQEYFDEAQLLINNRIVTKKKYRNYVAYATQTIHEVSKGEVKLDAPPIDIPNRSKKNSKQKPETISEITDL